MQPRTYLIVALGVAAALVGAVVAINVRVDPYGITGAADATAPTELGGSADVARPGAFWRKALTVRDAMPRTIVLGTSRAEFGIDSYSRTFAPEYAPVLNLSLGGLSIEQIRLLMTHANATSAIRMAVIGLDMESFLDDGRTDFDPTALKGNPESEPPGLVRLRLDASREALSASVARLMAPHAAPASTVTRGQIVQPQAWRIPDDALQLYDGQRGMIWVAEYDNFYARSRYLFPPASTLSRWSADPKRAGAMSSFRELLRYARSHDIALRLFISPVHARYLEWYERVGWWPLFEAWKRALVDALDEEAKAAPGRPAVVLWDFGGFHSISTEPVPGIGDHSTRMRWYRDTSHYSPEVGNLVLERILGTPGLLPSPFPEAGLTGATIDLRLAEIRSGAEHYRRAEPGEIKDIAEMLAYLRRVAKK
jgi:hypothetical protein